MALTVEKFDPIEQACSFEYDERLELVDGDFISVADGYGLQSFVIAGERVTALAFPASPSLITDSVDA